jgi:hypothetical protein
MGFWDLMDATNNVTMVSGREPKLAGSLPASKNFGFLEINFPIAPGMFEIYCTAKTKYRIFETNIPRKGISGSQSQFPHSCVCE